MTAQLSTPGSQAAGGGLGAYRRCCRPGCRDQRPTHLLSVCLHPLCSSCANEAKVQQTCPSPDCGLVSGALLDNVALLLQPLPSESLCSDETCLINEVHGANDQRYPVAFYCESCNLRMCHSRMAGHGYQHKSHRPVRLPEQRPAQLICHRHPNCNVTMLCRRCNMALCSECCEFTGRPCPECAQCDTVRLVDSVAAIVYELSARSAALRSRAVQLANNLDRLAEARRRLAASASRVTAGNRQAVIKVAQLSRGHVTDVASQISALSRQRRDRLCQMLSAWSSELVSCSRTASLAKLITGLQTQSANGPSLVVRQRMTVAGCRALEQISLSAKQQSAAMSSAESCTLGQFTLIRLDFSKAALPQLLTLGGPCLRLIRKNRNGDEEEIPSSAIGESNGEDAE